MGRSSITKEDAEKIRSRYLSGEKVRTIALDYPQVTRSAVSLYATGVRGAPTNEAPWSSPSGMTLRTSQRGVVIPVLENLPTKVGVYRLYNTLQPERSYIGSTVDLQDRAHEHWRDFQSGQRSNSSYIFEPGMETVVFEVLQHLPNETPKFDPDLLLAEERWTSHFASKGEVTNTLVGLSWPAEVRNARRKSDDVLNDEKRLRQLIRHHARQLDYYEEALRRLR